MKYFKYIIIFNQVTFTSTTPISNYKGGAFEYLIDHFRTLVVCPVMCAGDVIIWKKQIMGTEIVEKNTIRTFSYSTAVQEITLSDLMFFNNRKRCGYRCFSSEKGNVKSLNQNLKIHEKTFDNFN